ncbi:MAG TPA: secretion protein HlyD [Elusimicrobia bacterium]|nr:secretion protein HlyD [Elusimicrobiota bacterium]HBT60562.1 secretion protein HlyD [Elusimicrobiota bacterium]
MRSKKILILALLAAVMAALLAWKLFRRDDFLYAGTIEATEVDISPRLSSVIASFDAKEGQRLRAGDPMVRLSCEDVKLAADIAERDFKRAQRLKDSSMTEEAYDRLKHKRDDSALKLDWCAIKAPMDSTVLSTYHEPDELVSPGMTLLTLADLRRVWAIVYVPQPLLAKLSLNMEVEGSLPEMPARRLKGRISHINDEAEFTPKNVQTREERTRLVFGVKVEFSNTDDVLKPGMTVEIRLPKA